jgi:hypothetical protein
MPHSDDSLSRSLARSLSGPSGAENEYATLCQCLQWAVSLLPPTRLPPPRYPC